MGCKAGERRCLAPVECAEFGHFCEDDDGRQLGDARNRDEDIETGSDHLILPDQRNSLLINRCDLAFNQPHARFILAQEEP